MLILTVATLIRATIPYLVRYIDYGSAIYEFQWDSWVYSIIETLLGSVLIFVNLLFVYGGYIDFQRRVIMMRACGAMLDPIKENYDALYRQFPTINLVCPHDLYCWFQLRMSLMDVGRKYMSRIFIYSSTFLGCYLFYLVILLLDFFGFISMNLSLMANSIAMYDIVIVVGVNLMMLQFGATVNNQYQVDQFQLVQIKESLTYIKIHIKEILVPIPADSAILPRMTVPYLKIMQRMLFVIMKHERLNQDEMKERIESLISEIDTIRERLDIDSTQRPLKLLGLTASYELMNQIYTTLATIALAVGQKVIGG